MIFDLSKLQLARVVKTLYRHANPYGYGIVDVPLEKNEELSTEEIQGKLMDGVKNVGGIFLIQIWSLNSRPIRFELECRTKFANATEYDKRNGKHRFLNALVAEFGTQAIDIKRFNYPKGVKFGIDDSEDSESELWRKFSYRLKLMNSLSKN